MSETERKIAMDEDSKCERRLEKLVLLVRARRQDAVGKELKVRSHYVQPLTVKETRGVLYPVEKEDMIFLDDDKNEQEKPLLARLAGYRSRHLKNQTTDKSQQLDTTQRSCVGWSRSKVEPILIMLDLNGRNCSVEECYKTEATSEVGDFLFETTLKEDRSRKIHIINLRGQIDDAIDVGRDDDCSSVAALSLADSISIEKERRQFLNHAE